MKATIWSGREPVLADTSAWIAARRLPRQRARFVTAVDRGDVAWCWPVRYELTYDARDAETIAAVERTLDGLREVAVDRSVQRGVLALMRELATGGAHGSHRFPLTDLTVAVAASHVGLAVLHFDAHFDRLAAAAGCRTLWLARPGS